MTSFVAALTAIVLPIFLIAGIAFLLGRMRVITEPRPLARMSLYFFSPALVLQSLSRSTVSNSDLVSILIFTLAMALIVGALALTLTRVLAFDRLLSSAFMLSVLFVNAGNMGLPFNQFAFGTAGVARAAVYFVGNSVLSHTLAVYIASSGRHDVRKSLAAVIKLPLVYAAILGLFMNHLRITLPDPLARSLDLAAGAAVPVMLTILGLELARARWRDYDLRVWLATALKLIVTPAIALVLAALMHLQGLTRAVAVIEASMPTAVMATLIAVEFDTRSDFVTSVILLSTLGSMVTLVLLLLFLGYSPG